MYSFRTTLRDAGADPVELAFTDRHGGVSGVPFDTLNLSFTGDDDPAARARNLELVLADFAGGRATTYADLSQVHGCEVVEAAPVRPPRRPRGDGLVSDRPGVVLLVRAADCVPVLLADAAAGVVGAAHAGRQGVAVDVVGCTVERMRALGATDVTAWVGPHVCGACYEVPAALRDEVGAVVPAAVATTSWGTPSLDLGAGVRAQLHAAGVRRQHEVGRCTRESPDLFSYRRDGAASGRLAGLVMIAPQDAA